MLNMSCPHCAKPIQADLKSGKGKTAPLVKFRYPASSGQPIAYLYCPHCGGLLDSGDGRAPTPNAFASTCWISFPSWWTFGHTLLAGVLVPIALFLLAALMGALFG
jgi:hypothetical protein